MCVYLIVWKCMIIFVCSCSLLWMGVYVVCIFIYGNFSLVYIYVFLFVIFDDFILKCIIIECV